MNWRVLAAWHLRAQPAAGESGSIEGVVLCETIFDIRCLSAGERRCRGRSLGFAPGADLEKP